MVIVARPRSDSPRPPAALLVWLALALAFALVGGARTAARADPARDLGELARQPPQQPQPPPPRPPPQQPPPARQPPSVATVVAAAYRAAGLHHDPSRSWIRRARLAGLIPWLSVRTGRDISWQSDVSSVDHDMAIDVRATWRLDRLAFDGRELQVASIEAARRRERRRLATHVIRVYFVWQRAVGRPCPGGGCDEGPAGSGLSDDPEWPSTRSRAYEAAAELDALTDGWFSEELESHAAVRPNPGHPGRR